MTAQVTCRHVLQAVTWSTVCHPPALAQVGTYLALLAVLFLKTSVDIVITLSVISSTMDEYNLCPHNCMSSLAIVLFMLCPHRSLPHNPLSNSSSVLIVRSPHYHQITSFTVLKVNIRDHIFSCCVLITFFTN